VSEIVDVTGDGRREGVRRAAEALRDGQVVVLPTDTRYGLAADAFDQRGTAEVFVVKRSLRRFPLPVLVRSPKQLTGLTTTLPEAADRLVAAFWPGPLTIVVVAEPNLQWDLGESEGTVAVRMPLDDVALDVIREVGPLAVTSANRWGLAHTSSAQEVRDQLGDAVALYLDDGPRDAATVSTIVDLTRSEPHVLREGALPADRVLAVAAGEIDPADAALDDPDHSAGAVLDDPDPPAES
jgi:L-threonylcarbamoyladenylate synthase